MKGWVHNLRTILLRKPVVSIQWSSTSHGLQSFIPEVLKTHSVYPLWTSFTVSANQLASKVFGNLSFISAYEPCEYFLLEIGHNAQSFTCNKAVIHLSWQVHIFSIFSTASPFHTYSSNPILSKTSLSKRTSMVWCRALDDEGFQYEGRNTSYTLSLWLASGLPGGGLIKYHSFLQETCQPEENPVLCQ